MVDDGVEDKSRVEEDAMEDGVDEDDGDDDDDEPDEEENEDEAGGSGDTCDCDWFCFCCHRGSEGARIVMVYRGGEIENVWRFVPFRMKRQ